MDDGHWKGRARSRLEGRESAPVVVGRLPLGCEAVSGQAGSRGVGSLFVEPALAPAIFTTMKRSVAYYRSAYSVENSVSASPLAHF